MRGLVARGLSGVKCVVSDAHDGLQAVIAAVPEGTSWQRYRTHFSISWGLALPPRRMRMLGGAVSDVGCL